MGPRLNPCGTLDIAANVKNEVPERNLLLPVRQIRPKEANQTTRKIEIAQLAKKKKMVHCAVRFRKVSEYVFET